VGFVALAASGVDGGCQSGDRRRLVQVPDADLHAELVMDCGENLHSLKRMAAELEEVLVDANGCEPEDAREYRGDGLLGARAPRRRDGPRLALRVVREREGIARDLAVRRHQQSVDLHEGARHHVHGEVLGQEAAQLRRRGGPSAPRHDVGDEALVSRHVLPAHDGRLGDAGMAGEHALDLTALDPEAAHRRARLPGGEDLLHAHIEPDRAELHDPVARRKTVEARDRDVVVDEPAVGQHHPLGLSGRAGRVDQIREVARADAAGRSRGWRVSDRREVAVHGNHARGRTGKPSEQPLGAQRDRW
jgi:hypothetical protein